MFTFLTISLICILGPCPTVPAKYDLTILNQAGGSLPQRQVFAPALHVMPCHATSVKGFPAVCFGPRHASPANPFLSGIARAAPLHRSFPEGGGWHGWSSSCTLRMVVVHPLGHLFRPRGGSPWLLLSFVFPVSGESWRGCSSSCLLLRRGIFMFRVYGDSQLSSFSPAALVLFLLLCGFCYVLVNLLNVLVSVNMPGLLHFRYCTSILWHRLWSNRSK